MKTSTGFLMLICAHAFACTTTDGRGPDEDPVPMPTRAAVADEVERFLAGDSIELVVTAQSDADKTKIGLLGSVQGSNFQLNYRVRLDRSNPATLALLQSWSGAKPVTIRWNDDQFLRYRDGQERELVMRDELGDTLVDDTIRPVCGDERRLAGNAYAMIDGQTIKAIVTMGVQPRDARGAIGDFFPTTANDTLFATTIASDVACEDHAILIYNWCSSSSCTWVERVQDQTQDVCLRVQVSGTATTPGPGSGPYGSGSGTGSAQYENKIHSQTLGCWAQYSSSTCTLVADWIDHCDCVANALPTIRCYPISGCAAKSATCSSPGSCTASPPSTGG